VDRVALTTSASRAMFSGKAQEKDGRQPLDRTVGDEGEVAEDGDGSQETHVRATKVNRTSVETT